MIIDMHTHLFNRGWVPKGFFYGVARFITHEFAKQGIDESNESVGDGIMEGSGDPDAEMLLAEMDEAGIDKSVIFPVDFGLALGDPEVPSKPSTGNLPSWRRSTPTGSAPSRVWIPGARARSTCGSGAWRNGA